MSVLISTAPGAWTGHVCRPSWYRVEGWSMSSGLVCLDFAMARPSRDSHPLCSSTNPQVGSGACLSAGAKGVTPKVVCTAGSLGSALAICFPKAGWKQSEAGSHLLLHLALLGERLLDSFCIMSSDSRCTFTFGQQLGSIITCVMSFKYSHADSHL